MRRKGGMKGENENNPNRGTRVLGKLNRVVTQRQMHLRGKVIVQFSEFLFSPSLLSFEGKF